MDIQVIEKGGVIEYWGVGRRNGGAVLPYV